MHTSEPTPTPPEQAGQTLAALLRLKLAGQSWTAVRKVISDRRVQINGTLCLDPARRIKEGEVISLLQKSAPIVRGERPEHLVIRYVDEHVVVAEKASGINTVRHPSELEWKEERRELSPTLQDNVQIALSHHFKRSQHELPRLRIVQRLDKDTSGLVVFGRSILAERELGRQFYEHTVVRRYQAIVPGFFTGRTMSSWFVRDRGDGRRGTGAVEGVGKRAVTHVEVVEHLARHTLLSCRLETGRTHQIRIHLSEAGHPICGEKVYIHRPHGEEIVPLSTLEAPRLALHATELGFQHPATNEKMRWEMPFPKDLQNWIERLRKNSKPNQESRG